MIDKILNFAYSNTKFTFVFLGSLGAAGLGIAFATINSQETNKSFLFRTVTEKESGDAATYADGKKFSELEVVNFSYQDLLSGTKNFNDGNYLIYYGSEACSHCMKFLFGDENTSKGNLDLTTSKMSEGAFMKTYKFTKENDKLKAKKIKFLLFEDTPPSSDNRTDDDLWTLPWSKWSKTELNKGHVVGEFKRYDDSAVNLRNIMDYATEVFGEDKVSGTPTVIIYKDGYPKVFKKDKIEGLNEDSASTWDNENELKKYILYYYNKEHYQITPTVPEATE